MPSAAMGLQRLRSATFVDSPPCGGLLPLRRAPNQELPWVSQPTSPDKSLAAPRYDVAWKRFRRLPHWLQEAMLPPGLYGHAH
eukprot:13438207-Alexandrium_andersonii.AAC.1